MFWGIFARVGDHSEIVELAKHSPVPVPNALSSLWHPTQILADLTLHQHSHLFRRKAVVGAPRAPPHYSCVRRDSANVLHDMLVTYPRFGHSLRIARPENEWYHAPKAVWDRVVELNCDKKNTFISMGQEAEEARLRDFQGYQVTEQLCKDGGANPDWKFLHCLPQKSHEVDDEVFYGPRSLVFPEANRKNGPSCSSLSE